MNPEHAVSAATPGHHESGTSERSSAMQRALLSLQNSRQALRNEMMPPPEPAQHANASGDSWSRWWRRLRRWPAGQLAREAALQWWQRQPLHPLGNTLAGEVRQTLGPLVRRHPWLTVGAAAAAGAGIVAMRPWRWRWLDSHVRQLPRFTGRWLWQQLNSAPMQAAVASLLVMATSKAAVQSADQASSVAAHDKATSGEAAEPTGNDPQAHVHATLQ